MAGTTQRDRWFDLLRAVAIVRVIAYHAFPAVALEVVFPSMGVMFALGGSLMAASLDRGGAGRAVRSRLRRLLPALWVMAAVLVPLMLVAGWADRPGWARLLLWVLPVADPPAAAWAEPAAGVLWYLVTYLWLVLLSPWLLRLYRRAPVPAFVLLMTTVSVLSNVDTVPGGPGWVATNVGTFGVCWLLGFAHRDGQLRRIPGMLAAVIAAVCAGGGLAWAWVSRGAEGFDPASRPLAYAVFSAGFVLALLRWAPPMGWLARSRFLDGVVSLVNARAVTIYLWHNVAITGAVVLATRLDVWRAGVVEKEVFLAIALVLLANLVLALGWVEDLAARRPVRALPWPAPPGAADVAVPVPVHDPACASCGAALTRR